MAKLVECVPNFSVSREKDPVVFQGLVDTANSIPGCFVFDVQSDGNHNRCVFTLLGSPEAMGGAAFQLTKKATETIDMRRHTGQHPPTFWIWMRCCAIWSCRRSSFLCFRR